MHSAIYQGFVWHKRFSPKENAFRYRVFMMYLDLAELDQVFSLSRLWSYKKFAPACFRRDDYFFKPADNTGKIETSLDAAVRGAVKDALGVEPDGAIRVLTNLRHFGYIINPISCYYCFSKAPEQLTALLIEVTNTPWGERTHYVLDMRHHQRDATIDFAKKMHVSPFMPMDMHYRWCGSKPGNKLQYKLENFTSRNATDQSRTFAAGVNFTRVEISRESLNRTIAGYPIMTAKVALGIYWQALRLSLKRVPFVPHPAK